MGLNGVCYHERMIDEKMNVNTLLEKDTEESYEEQEEYRANRGLNKTLKIAWIGIAALTVIILLFSGYKGYTEQRNDGKLYADAAKTIDSWMDRFQDIGTSSVEIGYSSTSSTSSFANHQLKTDLEKIAVDSNGTISTLSGTTVELKKGKTYTLNNSATGEVLYDSTQAKGNR